MNFLLKIRKLERKCSACIGMMEEGSIKMDLLKNRINRSKKEGTYDKFKIKFELELEVIQQDMRKYSKIINESIEELDYYGSIQME